MTHIASPSSASPRRIALAAWLSRLCRRPSAVRLDPDALPADMLRDIGLMDGRGPSLRRPERPD